MKRLLLIYLMGLMIILAPGTVEAQIFNQPPPSSGTGPSPFSQTDNIQPGNPLITDTPIDGGVVFLIIIGLTLGIRRFRSKGSISSATL